MNRKLWSVVVCLSLAVVAVAVLIYIQRQKTIRTATASPRRVLAQRTGHASFQPDTHKDLLFDPVLAYSTYLGGASSANYPFDMIQVASVIVTDATGNLYVAGSTNSRSFPVTSSVVEPNNPQKGLLGFLAKLDPTGQTLLFSTYIDGISGVSAMALDANGDIYVAGTAISANNLGIPVLPIPSGSTPFQSSPRGMGILKLNATATTVLAATYFGGSGNDKINSLAVKPGTPGSNLYITGQTLSNDFPVQAPLQASLGSSGNSFVTVLNPALSAAVYSTYLGQSSVSFSGFGPHSIAVDTAGDAYVVGSANANFPTTSGALQTTCPDSCSFISVLNPSGSQLLFSTYFGTGGAQASAVAVDSAKNIYFEGSANVSSGITAVNPVPGFVACSTPNTSSGFVSEINASGSLAFSTCVVGSGPRIVLDGSNNVSISGIASTGFPLQNPIQSHASQQGDAYVATINPTNGSLVFSSFLGDGLGAGPTINDIAIDPSGNLYAAGYGNNLPVFRALQPVPAGGDPPCPVMNPCLNGTNVDIMKIAPTNAPAAALVPAALAFPAQAIGVASTAQTVEVVDLGSTSLTVSNATATGDFSVQDGCTSAVTAAGGTCTLQVTFTPTALGTRTGTLTITDSSAGSPRTVQLTGIGGQAAVGLSPNPLSFKQAINTTGTSPVTLANTGTIPLQISTIQTSGATFSEANVCGILVPAGQSCVINVSFAPTVIGNATGTLTITDSATGSPHSVALTGTGVADSIGLSYPPNGFPSAATVAVGSAAFTAVQVGGGGLAGTVSLSCSGLPQGATCIFDPASPVQMSATGARQVNLSITTTARSHIFAPLVWITTLTLLAMCVGILFLMRATFIAPPRLRWRLVPVFALAICACGGGTGSSPNGGGGTSTGTPAGSHVIVITATSGSASQTLLFNLTVQ
jgi:hypothetical protein